MDRPNRRSGMVLVTVLWAIALLAALAMAASATFRGFAGIVAIDRDRARAAALLDGGLEVAAGLVARLGDRPLTPRETSLSLSSGTVHLSLSDEGGRIDVNQASPKLLTSLLKAAGAGRDAAMIAQAIVAWREQDEARLPAAPDASGAAQNPAQAGAQAGAQAQAAGQAGQPGQPPAPKKKNAHAFTDLRQLAQIPGMSPDLLAAVIPLATVFGDEKVNALTASPEVIAALPGLSPAQAASFVAARSRPTASGDLLSQLLGPAKDEAKTEGQPVAAVTLTAHLPDGYRAAAQAIVTAIPEDKQPYRVLAFTPLPSPVHRAALIPRFEDE